MALHTGIGYLCRKKRIMAHQHTHDHSHAHQHNHGDVKNIKAAFFLNLVFTIIEIVGGAYTNSVAILSDAIHDLGDSLSLGLAWYFQKISQKGSDKSYSYGYKRFSLLGALINSIVLITGSILILNTAIPRIFHPAATKTEGMFLLAIVGVIVNGIAAFRLTKGSSINERVVSLHLLEDVLGWLAILIGSVVMYFWDVPVLDPLMSIGIACFILFNVFRNVKQTLHILLQGTPDEIDLQKISEDLVANLSEIDSVHDVHAWSVDGNYNVMTVHVVLKAEANMHLQSEMKDKIRALLNEEGIQHVTIEFETNDESCRFENCCS